MDTASKFPFYFPTTVLLVDDNREFLKNFSLQFDDDLAYCLYDSPVKALELLNASQESTLDKRCFSNWQQLSADVKEGRLLHLDLGLIEQEVSNRDRFGEVSVVIVDFAMQGMDGLEFCKKIENPRVKKVLFTGVADEDIAIKAFNEGIIDRFIKKSEPNVINKIQNTIEELKMRYFQDVSFMIQNTLALRSPSFFNDLGFDAFFRDILRSGNFVEYYYVDEPAGYLLVTSSGKLSRLIVYNDEELNRMVEKCKEQRAPASVIATLQAGESVPYFWQDIEDYYEGEDYPWNDCLYNARSVYGDQIYHYALINNPPVDIEFNQNDSNYDCYLDLLDQQQQKF